MDSIQYITRLKQGPHRKLLKKANTIYIYVEKRRVVKIMISYTNRSRIYQKVIDEFSNANKDSQKYIDDLNLDITNLKISVSSFNESEVSIKEMTDMINKEGRENIISKINVKNLSNYTDYSRVILGTTFK